MAQYLGDRVDRLGTRITYAASLILWRWPPCSRPGFERAMLFGFRWPSVLPNAPCFPCNSRILSTWFPQTNGAGYSAMPSAVCRPRPSSVRSSFDRCCVWAGRSLFFLAGAIGIVFGLAMYGFYQPPLLEQAGHDAELEHIKAGRRLTGSAAAASEPFSWANCAGLMRSRQIVGAQSAVVGGTPRWSFPHLVSDLLATERDMDWLKSGIYVVLPYIAASVGVLLGGISDGLLRRTSSANVARKLPIVGRLLLASTISPQTTSRMIFVHCHQVDRVLRPGHGNLGWTLISDVAPRQLIGLTEAFSICAPICRHRDPDRDWGDREARRGSFYGAPRLYRHSRLIGAASYFFVIAT